MMNKVSQLLIGDFSFTQREIANELNEEGSKISASGVCRLLKKMEYTRKRLIKIPEERSSQKNLESRQIYGREIEYLSDANLIFLDETCVNMLQSRNYSYSPKNVKAYQVVKANRGTDISYLVAIKNTGILGFQIKDGSFEGSSFKSFFQEKLVPHLSNKYDVLVMDNCRFHHRKDVMELLVTNNIKYRFLPPYSPQLNPIEEYFSHLKSILSFIHPSSNTRDKLKSRINNVLINEHVDFNGWFNHMRKYVEKAISKQDFI